MHGSTHPAMQDSGRLPQCSTLGRLPSAGVLSCSVSQHRHAPTRPMNCVTFEQTHVTCRGAGQTSTGNSTRRTYILILAPESTHTLTHCHTHSHTSHTQTGLSLPGRVSLPSPFQYPLFCQLESLQELTAGHEWGPRIQGCQIFDSRCGLTLGLGHRGHKCQVGGTHRCVLT